MELRRELDGCDCAGVSTEGDVGARGAGAAGGSAADYDAQGVRIANGSVVQSVAEMLAERGVRRMVVPVGLPIAWLPGSAEAGGVEFVVDEGLSSGELDGFDGVMTGTTLAIAETGTVVLQNVSDQGRRAATLVADYHLCVVRAEDVVETVSEQWSGCN
jgi:L-lactate dehydrogenase complex protein LldG